MSPVFLKRMMKLFKCRICVSRRQAGKKFCSVHLARARRKWHEHVQKCLSVGTCVNCPSPRLVNEQRCAPCKARNRVKCRTWMRLHYRERTYKFLDQGRCPACAEHRILEAGRFYCAECRAGQRMRRGVVRIMYAQLLQEAGLQPAVAI